MEFFDYNKIMFSNMHGIDPVDVRGVYNLMTCYHSRYLLNKIFSSIDLDLKENDTKFPLNFFRFNYFVIGRLGAFKVDEKTNLWILAPFTIEKFDIYYNPVETKIAFTNEKIQQSSYANKTFKVGVDCVIFKCFDDYRGFSDLVRTTATTLANIDKAVNVAITNNNVSMLSYAKSHKEASEIKKAYERATKGEPMVVIDKTLEPETGGSLMTTFCDTFTGSMLDKLLTSRRTVMNNFLTEIGINNANIDKKERLNSMEVNSNSDEVSANIMVVLNNLKKSIDEFNKLSGYELTADLKYNYNDEEYTVNENSGEVK